MCGGVRQRYEHHLNRELNVMLNEGYEMPFDDRVVRKAAESVGVAIVTRKAQEQGRPVLAWLLSRWLRQIRTRPC